VAFGSEASQAWFDLGRKLGTAFHSAGSLVSMAACLLVLVAGSGLEKTAGVEAVLVVDFEQLVAVVAAVEIEERFAVVASAAVADPASFHPRGSLMPLARQVPLHLLLPLQMAC
jgi:hypothetical protein